MQIYSFEVSMRYINFVVLCICLACSLSAPANAVEIGSIIHYSEQEVRINEIIYLEQGYSFVVRDINSNSGDLWLDLYLNGSKLDSDNFVKESSPLEYIKTVEIEDDDDVEEEHLVIRVSSFGDVDGSGSDMTSRIKIEQFDHGETEKDDYVLFDHSMTVDVEKSQSLGAGYSLEFSDMDDDVILLKFSKDKELLKEEEIEEGEYFYYTTDATDNIETVFLGKVNNFFVTSDSEMVFMEHVTLKKDISLDLASNNDAVVEDNGTSLVVGSSDGSKLEEGNVAIIQYSVPESFSSIRVLMNGDVIDTRYNVGAGAYSTVSGKLSAGEHELSVVGVSDELEQTLVSKKIIIEASLRDSLSSSAKGLAESAGDALNGSDSPDSNIPGMSDSTVIVVLLCVILILIIAPRKKSN